MNIPSQAEALTTTLLAPLLFLMAVVVLYGCLLMVLAHRARLGRGSRHLLAGSPLIDTHRPDASEAPVAAPDVVSSDRKPVRFLLVVSRQNPARFQELRRIFGDIGNTDVIVDRRRAEPRAARIPTPMTRQHAERRQRNIEDDLRMTGWALLRLPG
jgi:hypothetical protein